ncbi:unnamed protein product [Phytophthora fragariaefolia]|uniref:Unnamed protein product n=1 Tax=Phytophthora fragariaefolia TaxID=1490495 RepID=A0A9W6TQ41_9STRA|nr:unnamed protein product [Phytophthora fragariaefolia]
MSKDPAELVVESLADEENPNESRMAVTSTPLETPARWSRPRPTLAVSETSSARRERGLDQQRRLRAAGGGPEPLHDVPRHEYRREEAVSAHLGAGPAHRPGSGELGAGRVMVLLAHWCFLAGYLLLLQALQSTAQFEQNLANVSDARGGGVNWEHENVERPLPQFMSWLETQRYKTDESLVSPLELDVLIDILEERGITPQRNLTAVAIVLDALSIGDWSTDPDLVVALKPIMLKLGARYIYHEKKRGKALDPVTNFHVRNGAIFERINWLADLSKKTKAKKLTIFDGILVDAFVACGGKPDKSGFVRKETLVKIIKGDFGLTINIEEMINKLDVDGSGEIEFDEFKAILT